MRNADKRSVRALTALVLAAALVFGSFITLPEKAYAAGPSDIAVGDFVDVGKADISGYTGVPHWRVLDKGDDGSLFLMSEYLWKGDGINASVGVGFMERNEWYKPDGQRDFRGTKAETWCNEFESSVLDVDGLKIIPQTVSDAEYIYEQTKYDSNNKKLKFRQAGTILYQNDVYFLSAEEADRYLGPVYNDKVAYMPESTSASAWYLRSTEISTGNNSATEVKADGELAYVNADQTRAARPVFWASFSDKASFDLKTDESGNRTWTYEESSAVPEPVEEAKAAEEKKATEEKAKAEAEAKARAVTSVTVGGSTVTADSINAAVAAAGGKTEYVTEIIIGKGVKKISKNAFAGTKVTTLIVKTKKLKKKSVKGSLRGSAVTTIKVQVGKAKANKKYVKNYKKIFTKKNAGKKAKVKK